MVDGPIGIVDDIRNPETNDRMHKRTDGRSFNMIVSPLNFDHSVVYNWAC